MLRPAQLLLTLAILLFSATKGWSADFQKGADAAQRGDYATALSELKPLAQLMDARAQHALGLMCKDGHGVPQDHNIAAKWITNAANQGLGDAQFSLGIMYDNGEGVPRNYKTAMEWYRLTAEQGDAHAQHILGWLYQQGKGVPQSHKIAIKWFRLAARQGLGNVRFYLLLMYVLPEGVQNFVFDPIFHNLSLFGKVGIIDNALYWYTLSAKQGNAYAQSRLGEMYHHGEGVTQNHTTARKWYRLAEKQGHSDAQFRLGALYAGERPALDGRGVHRNYKTAVKWYRLAAEQGCAEAQFKLGMMYTKGTGVRKDNIYARMWFNVAASLGQIDAPFALDRFEKRLTTSQIAEAQKLADVCIKMNFRGC